MVFGLRVQKLQFIGVFDDEWCRKMVGVRSYGDRCGRRIGRFLRGENHPLIWRHVRQFLGSICRHLRHFRARMLVESRCLWTWLRVRVGNLDKRPHRQAIDSPSAPSDQQKPTSQPVIFTGLRSLDNGVATTCVSTARSHRAYSCLTKMATFIST